ncbi:hypothetical protein [Polaromonas sp. YR568]|uniref:hypothetical protein n=1 Tax=Polaromonas sp. YR568 TaxID=1855301 RepID=UPI00398C01AD
MMSRWVWIFIFGLSANAFSATGTDIPWLWDRTWPSRFQSAELAVLVHNIELRGSSLRERPRLQVPVLALSTRVTPVVHVEFNLLETPVQPAAFNDAIRDAVVSAAQMSTSGWVQLDYEARPRGREAYLQLVRDIRRALPAKMRLSVTALAWWCQGGAWLDTLAADEVVPMMFRMGPDAQRLRTLVREQPGKLHPRCRGPAVGLARQEPQLNDISQRYARRYWFDYKGWKDTDLWPMELP